MTRLLGEWRKGKVRPIPGNAPHDRPVSRVIFHRQRAFATIPSTPLDSRSIKEYARAHGVRFLRHGGIYHTDVVKIKIKNQTRAGIDRLPPVGPDPGGRTRREDHALLIVCDEFRPAIP